MKSSLVLEMLNQNRIEELKAKLQDEIFIESLGSKADTKKRYAAMKRYLNTVSESRPILTKPCEVDFEGEQYNSFTNGYSLALTKESCGELKMCDEPDRYPDVTRLITFKGDSDILDLNAVLAKAKSKGYKYTKNAILKNDFLMHYKEAYFRVALVDITYGIINKNEKVDIWYSGVNRPITIKNDLGICTIMPVRIDGEPEEGVVVIEA